jgi:DNA-binding NarL/FixJ family response regulator
MPEMDGITATAALRSLDAPPHVIVLTTFQADEQVMSALRAGADGFLLKDTPPAEIITAVRLVASGEAMLSPSVTRTLLSHRGVRAPSPRHATAGITHRPGAGSGARHRVRRVQRRGASSLFMSEATVKAHVSRLLSKLDVANRVHVAIVVHDACQR